MEILGKINSRSILYTNIRKDLGWIDELPNQNWVVFTIGDDSDVDFENSVVENCLNKNVNYICCTGQLANCTELGFDFEIVKREIENEKKTGIKYDYGTICTTAHSNFSEGFWYATNVAFDPYLELDKVVCIDFTFKGVKNNLKDLIDKINNKWLPSDDEFEVPIYDN